jgi:hypothetical protein
VRRRVDLEREAGDFEPGEKRNFLSARTAVATAAAPAVFMKPRRLRGGLADAERSMLLGFCVDMAAK